MKRVLLHMEFPVVSIDTTDMGNEPVAKRFHSQKIFMKKNMQSHRFGANLATTVAQYTQIMNGSL